MIKPVGARFILEMPTVLCETTESDGVELLCCTASTWAVFQVLELVQDGDSFSFHVRLVRFVGAVVREWNTITACWRTGVAVFCRAKCLSSSHTCN